MPPLASSASAAQLHLELDKLKEALGREQVGCNDKARNAI